MLCQKCKKNNAVYYYKQTINGVTKKTALCQDCYAMEQNNSDSLAYKMNQEMSHPLFAHPYFGSSLFDDDFFGNGFLGSLFGENPYQTNLIPEKKKCTLCGSSFDDIRSRGKVGCAQCYETFKEELKPTVNSIHGTARHIGRKPKKI